MQNLEQLKGFNIKETVLYIKRASIDIFHDKSKEIFSSYYRYLSWRTQNELIDST